MEKLVDFLIALLIGIGSVFLVKVILVSIGSQYSLEFFANMTWKDYWGASFIGSLYILGTMIRVNTKADKKESEFPLTTNAITHVLMMLFVWGVASAVNGMFFS